MLPVLNLPSYEHRITELSGVKNIFDPVRKKNVVLTPEEWVRQNFLRFLIEEKKYPASRMAVEKQLQVYGMNRRCDIVYYNGQGIPEMIVECKAPEITLNRESFDQLLRYNITMRVPLLILTNGMVHYCCKLNSQSNEFQYLTNIPSVDER